MAQVYSGRFARERRRPRLTFHSTQPSATKAHWHPRAFVRPYAEQLEPRIVLTGAAEAYEQVDPAWFAAAEQTAPPAFVGPLPAVAISPVVMSAVEHDSRWLVRLTPEAAAKAEQVDVIADLLTQDAARFYAVRGLGLPGLVAVTTQVPDEYATQVLETSPYVEFFEPDTTVQAQRTPDDPDFVAGSMLSLHNTGQFGGTADADIDAPEVWDETIGTTDIVVGVIDSGIDPTHADLYLNIWINQGEIPTDLAGQLEQVDGDVDSDGRITFYDLNNCAVADGVSDPGNCDWTVGPNAGLVADSQDKGEQGHGYIDAVDLLEDPRWADGRDTDGNGFIDDLFGWNFRSHRDEPFAPNNPSDVLGHGTHISGTLGAIGDNGLGVTGVNWQTSIMALKFLGENNRGRVSDAILAVNYATMMRDEFGVDVRVTNNSWGQAGGFSSSLQAAIRAAGEADILFVAAAGNGNILGRGVDNDRTAFYPASYELDNVIAVAASDSRDQLVQFSNFGATSVDIAAPGVGILSTLVGGGYGSANGTSMAAPHVTGTAALIWSALPEAPLAEVRDAILTTADSAVAFDGKVTANGRLNAADALSFAGFSPTASLLSAEDIDAAGGTKHQMVVQYTDRNGIDLTSLGDGDVLVSRHWGPRDEVVGMLVAGSIVQSQSGTVVAATYQIAAPGGDWDALDFGEYRISVVADEVFSSHGLTVPSREIGAFHVRIPDPSVFYVDTFGDSLDANTGDGVCADENGFCSLRAAIQESNRVASQARTVILDAGSYNLSIPHQVTVSSTDVPKRDSNSTVTSDLHVTGFAGTLGDVNVLLDMGWWGGRGSKVFLSSPSSTRVELHRSDASFSGIIILNGTILDDEAAVAIEEPGPRKFTGRFRPEGKLADFDGEEPNGVWTLEVTNATLNAWSLEFERDPGDKPATFPSADFTTGCHAGLYVTAWSNEAMGDLDVHGSVTVLGSATGATVIDGQGVDRVFKVHPDAELNLRRLTITGGRSPGDQGGGGIMSAGQLDLELVAISENAAPATPERSGGGGVAVWDGDARIHQSTISGNRADVGGGLFACNAATASVTHSTFVRNSASAGKAFQAALPGHVGGGGIASVRGGSILVENTTLSANTAEHVSGAAVFQTSGFLFGAPGRSESAALSDDGRFMAFVSRASNLVTRDTNGNHQDVFVFDRLTRTIERVSVASDGTQADRDSRSPSISGDGRYVAFESYANNLVPGDTNGGDVFVFDRQTRTIELVSVASDGTQATDYSHSPSISADGQFVTFVSQADNLVPGDTNGVGDVFVFDRQTRATERVSVASDGTQAAGRSWSPTISTDGRFVAFVSENAGGVFVFDRQARTIERVSVASDGTAANRGGDSPSISGDGRFVVFESKSTNLVSSDTNDEQDVFLFDRQTRTIGRVNVANDGTQHVWGGQPLISGDGQFVTFASRLDNDVFDLFVFNRKTQTIERLNLDNDERRQFPLEWHPAISGDGRFVAFASDASRLVPGDTNDEMDVFLFDRQTRALETLAKTSAKVTLEHVTAAFHQGFSTVDGIVDTHNSLFAGNTTAHDLIGARSLGHNVVTAAAASLLPTDKVDPLAEEGIGPLESVRGPTATHSLLQGSVAIDGADPDSFSILDQTGILRPIGGMGFTVLPDAGAVEAAYGDVRGTVFLDRDKDDLRDNDEAGLPSVLLYLDENDNDQWDTSEKQTLTSLDPNDRGTFAISFVPPGNHNLRVEAPSNWSVSVQDTLQRVTPDPKQIFTEDLSQPVLSYDGRIVAFVSGAANLVPDDTNNSWDVFVFDRKTQTVQRAPLNGDSYPFRSPSDGSVILHASSYPSINADGRYVAFTSGDVYVLDRQSQTFEQLSLNEQGKLAHFPSISADGRFVAFASDASNLVPDDTNNARDVFVFDRLKQTVQRVSVASDGTQADGPSSLFGDPTRGSHGGPAISSDGRFVVFSSRAKNLVPDDTNQQDDIFVFNLQTQVIQRVSVASDGTQADKHSSLPVISGDGRFVFFESGANNLVPNDPNNGRDLFSFDRQTHTTERVATSGASSWGNSISRDGRFFAFQGHANRVFVFDRQTQAIEQVDIGSGGQQPNLFSYRPSISGDGRFVAFESIATNLVPNDNDQKDIFVRLNPFASPAERTVILRPGGTMVVDIGLSPDPGEIRGTVFEDLIGNHILDAGEPRLAGWTVFLDLDEDGRPDKNEPATVTGTDGTYAFTDVDAHAEYTVSVLVNDGWDQVLPATAESGVWKLFLPAGGFVADRDFGFTRASTGGQFKNARIDGTLFIDDGDGALEPQEPGLGGVTVFLDLNDDGVRQFDEPRTVTSQDDPKTVNLDESGRYSFTGLGEGAYTVRALLDDQTQRQTAPLGNAFDTHIHALKTPGVAFDDNPQDVVVEDFTGDGVPDLAVALFVRNLVTILPGKGNGQFEEGIDINLGAEAAGPTALLGGQFNGSGSIDLAVANLYSHNVSVLLDFDSNTNQFTSVQHVAVGKFPRSLASGNFNAAAGLDLAVANSGSDSLTILRNTGNGVFIADVNTLRVGAGPSAVVAAQLTDDNGDRLANDDDDVDLVVANLGAGTAGSVSVLVSNRGGSFRPAVTYEVGGGPTAVTAADFNLDGFADLAVANFRSKTISLLMNQQDGRFPPKQDRGPDLAAGNDPADIEAADMDNDADVDLVVTNVTSKDVSILRNLQSQTGFGFEPPESFPLAAFGAVVQLRVSVANVDQDEAGLLDLVVANGTADDNVSVSLNHLVAGARRVGLTGVETVSGLDFAVQLLNVPPTLDEIDDPAAIQEDDPQLKSISLSGITDGRAGENQPLDVKVTTDNPALFSLLNRSYTPNSETGTIAYQLAKDQNGKAVVQVTVTDGGLDRILATAEDNEAISRSFTVIVNPVNDDPQATDDLARTAEDTPLEISWSELFSNDTDIDSPRTQWSIDLVFDALNGKVTNQLGVQRVRFEPHQDFHGLATFRYRLHDGDRGYHTAAVTVTVTPQNDPPTGLHLSSHAVKEADAGAVIGTLRVDDVDLPADAFTWTVSDSRLEVVRSQLTLKDGRTFDHEQEQTVSVDVVARDSGDATVQRTFVLTVTDVNEFAPVIRDVQLRIDENRPANTAVGNVSATDRDRTHSLIYSIAFGNVGNAFAINPATGAITTRKILDYEDRSRYVLGINVLDDLAPPKVASATVSIDVIPAAAQVTGAVLNGGSSNRSGVASLRLQFDRNTTVANAASLKFWNHTTGTPLETSAATLQGNGTAEVTWNLTGVSFPEGYYTAELPSTEVVSAGGTPLAATHTLLFHVLRGDGNGDGTVSFLDFANFSPYFGSTVGPYGLGDFDGNGVVNFGDLGILSANFGNSLAVPPTDFGDAPEADTSFPTKLENDGARHLLGSGIYLGSGVDAEQNARTGVGATGDDKAGADDEDGVAFAALQAGTNASVTVTASVPSGSTVVLNAWIDLNADGDWADMGEQVFVDQALSNGANKLSVSIPSTAVIGPTFARFRITTSAGYSYYGLAPTGEVEDYLVTISAASLWGAPRAAFSRAPVMFVADRRVAQVEALRPPSRIVEAASPAVQRTGEVVDRAVWELADTEWVPRAIAGRFSWLAQDLVDRVFAKQIDPLQDEFERLNRPSPGFIDVR